MRHDPDLDPFVAFHTEYSRAKARETFDADRAALATVDASGRPAARFVLVRELDHRGFAFYTSYRSDKARELAANPRAALAWHWESIGVQVRAEVTVHRMEPERSDAYFASRPRGSQLGAWASQQSAPIESREALDAQLDDAAARFEGAPVPRPPHWGGYVLRPLRMELWYAQADRLHDRFRYELDGERWVRIRLNP